MKRISQTRLRGYVTDGFRSALRGRRPGRAGQRKGAKPVALPKGAAAEEPAAGHIRAAASVSRGDMLPAAFAHLPRTDPQERSVAFCPVCSRARRPDAGCGRPFSPSKAGQPSAGAHGAERNRWLPMRHSLLGLFFAPANQGEGLENQDKTGISLQALGRDLGKNRMPLLSFLVDIGIITMYSSFPRSFPVAAGGSALVC